MTRAKNKLPSRIKYKQHYTLAFLYLRDKMIVYISPFETSISTVSSPATNRENSTGCNYSIQYETSKVREYKSTINTCFGFILHPFKSILREDCSTEPYFFSFVPLEIFPLFPKCLNFSSVSIEELYENQSEKSIRLSFSSYFT